MTPLKNHNGNDGGGRNPWMGRFFFGWFFEWRCKWRGHIWEQLCIAGQPCRYDALGFTLLCCRWCARLAYFNVQEWDALNTPLHQAIRKVL